MPIYTIFAGVNGAGKSTLYEAIDIPSDELGVRINFDEIIRNELGNKWNDLKIQSAAGKRAVQLIKKCLSEGLNFNQETTLTGHSIITTAKRARAKGFRIYLHYVGLSSAELSIERVEERVKKGGHGIPREILLRRYENSFENLKKLLPLCDKATIYDNSKSDKESISHIRPVLHIKGGAIIRYSRDYPQYLKAIIGGLI
ncbi:MAG: zeta toxin family protein [Clostridiales bacterium]|jgi:predicted ABC-type ATPase|nr:zeta toxin family protein [Clostridiales bacterium]